MSTGGNDLLFELDGLCLPVVVGAVLLFGTFLSGGGERFAADWSHSLPQEAEQ
jgi:hypothetical protein